MFGCGIAGKTSLFSGECGRNRGSLFLQGLLDGHPAFVPAVTPCSHSRSNDYLNWFNIATSKHEFLLIQIRKLRIVEKMALERTIRATCHANTSNAVSLTAFSLPSFTSTRFSFFSTISHRRGVTAIGAHILAIDHVLKDLLNSRARATTSAVFSIRGKILRTSFTPQNKGDLPISIG